MRKIGSILVLILICSLQVLSQAYIPMIDTNARWKQCRLPYPPGPMPWYTDHWDHILMGDTVINNLTYEKVGMIDYEVECSEIFTGPYYYTAIREDTIERKVYQYHPYGEKLLYDFSLELGDTLHTYIGEGLIAIAVDSIMVGDQYRKRWTYQEPTWASVDVVEGIGAITGLFEFMEFFEVIHYLRCYYYNDEPVYMYSDQCGLEIDTCLSVNIGENIGLRTIKTYPNPFTNSTAIEYELYSSSNIQLSIYNCMGEVVYKGENRMMVPGSHKVSWSPGHIPAGLYFGLLKSDDNLEVIKMLKH